MKCRKGQKSTSVKEEDGDMVCHLSTIWRIDDDSSISMKAIDLEEKYQIWWWRNLAWSLSGLKSGFFPSNPSYPSLQVTGEMFLGEIWQFFAKKKKKSANCLYSPDPMLAQNGGPILPLSVGRGGTALSFLTSTTMLLEQVISFHLVLTTGPRISWTLPLPFNAPLKLENLFFSVHWGEISDLPIFYNLRWAPCTAH